MAVVHHVQILSPHFAALKIQLAFWARASPSERAE